MKQSLSKIILHIAILIWGIYFLVIVFNQLPPKVYGAIEMGVGGNINLVSTEFIFDVPRNSMYVNFIIEFNNTDQLIRSYVVLPFETETANAELRYYDYDEQTEVTYLNVPSLGSSIVNSSYKPNSTYFLQGIKYQVKFTISIESLSDLISWDRFSTKNVILTFFGDMTGVFDEKMYSYLPHADVSSSSEKPLLVIIRFPLDFFLHSETYPNPSSYYVTNRFREVLWNLNCSEYAQTISCSYISPSLEGERELFILLGGLLIGVSLPALMNEFLNVCLGRKKRLMEYLHLYNPA
jgi:hypothetical protein